MKQKKQKENKTKNEFKELYKGFTDDMQAIGEALRKVLFVVYIIMIIALMVSGHKVLWISAIVIVLVFKFIQGFVEGKHDADERRAFEEEQEKIQAKHRK